MSTVKINNKDTYKAATVIPIVIGMLYLIDRPIHFFVLGIPWVMNKDNLLLYTAVIFLFTKRDKSVDLVPLGSWLVLNTGLIVSLLGPMSGYLLPLALLIIGGILYLTSARWKEV